MKLKLLFLYASGLSISFLWSARMPVSQVKGPVTGMACQSGKGCPAQVELAEMASPVCGGRR